MEKIVKAYCVPDNSYLCTFVLEVGEIIKDADNSSFLFFNIDGKIKNERTLSEEDENSETITAWYIHNGDGNPEKKISIYSFLSGDNECSSKAFIKSVDVNDPTVWTKGSNIIHTDKYNVNVEFETNYIKSREIKGENNGIAFTVDGYKFNTFRILPQGCTSDNNKLSISKNSKGIVLVIYEYKIETSFKPVTIESKEDWHIHEVVEQQVSNILNEYYTVK